MVQVPVRQRPIEARDGELDSVICGAGTDRVQADANDVVAPDCEHVNRGSAAVHAPGAAQSPSLTVAVTRTKLAKALARGLTVRVSVPGPGR